MPTTNIWRHAITSSRNRRLRRSRQRPSINSHSFKQVARPGSRGGPDFLTFTSQQRKGKSMDLSTTYLGLKLRTPLVPAASPLSEELDSIKEMEDSGASAVVLYSLFEEQLRQDRLELAERLEHGTFSYAESLTYFPEPEEFRLGPDEYLKHIAKAKEAVKIPVIASLNGSSVGGWTQYAKAIEQAGADALELNIYHIPTDMDLTSEDVEKTYLDILKAVKSEVKTPVAVKLSPFFTNFANMAKRLNDAGANGLVLFNRFYQPDIDLESLEIKPNILLSTPMAMRVPLRWIALMYGRIQASMAATSGIHRASDALKMLMAGADVTMLCSVLIRHGVRQIAAIERDLVAWMEEHDYSSVTQLKGSLSQKNCANPSAFERAQYMKAISQFPVTR
jgi:dihydroorotate dehydrogenase (fumarate)